MPNFGEELMKEVLKDCGYTDLTYLGGGKRSQVFKGKTPENHTPVALRIDFESGSNDTVSEQILNKLKPPDWQETLNRKENFAQGKNLNQEDPQRYYKYLNHPKRGIEIKETFKKKLIEILKAGVEYSYIDYSFLKDLFPQLDDNKRDNAYKVEKYLKKKKFYVYEALLADHTLFSVRIKNKKNKDYTKEMLLKKWLTKARKVAKHVLKALLPLHNAGFAHGDLTEDNIVRLKVDSKKTKYQLIDLELSLYIEDNLDKSLPGQDLFDLHKILLKKFLRTTPDFQDKSELEKEDKERLNKLDETTRHQLLSSINLSKELDDFNPSDTEDKKLAEKVAQFKFFLNGLKTGHYRTADTALKDPFFNKDPFFGKDA